MQPAPRSLFIAYCDERLKRAAVPIHAFMQSKRIGRREDLFAFGAAANFRDHESRASSIASAKR